MDKLQQELNSPNPTVREAALMVSLACELYRGLNDTDFVTQTGTRSALGEYLDSKLNRWMWHEIVELVVEGTPGLPTTLEQTQVWVKEWVASDSLREWAEGEGFGQDSLTRYLNS